MVHVGRRDEEGRKRNATGNPGKLTNSNEYGVLEGPVPLHLGHRRGRDPYRSLG